MRPVRCSFYARTPDGDGFQYEPVDAGGPNQTVPTSYPPAVGDLVLLAGGSYEVVGRQWLHPSLGSADWPYGPEPKVGPLLTLIVVAANGAFRDEAR